MKGLIVYSSLTGNTKKFAEKLLEGLSPLAEWQIQDLKDKPKLDSFDMVLVGGWADQGTLDKLSMKAFESLDKGKCKVGIFFTLGAMPDSFHGKKCEETLYQLLEGHDSLGAYLIPGLVDAKVLAGVEKIPDHVLPKDIKEQMIEAGKTSRWATEEEYNKAIAFFTNNINNS